MSRAGRRVLIIASLVATPMLLVGCNSGPKPLRPPDIDPADASVKAMELYDTNKDGQLSEQELAACPGMWMNRSSYDTDGNGSVSAVEIENRLQDLFGSGVGLTNLMVDVRLNGRPLKGAEVRFIPEAYLGTDVKPASGKTGQRGLAAMRVAPEDLPEEDRRIAGIQYGTYKVVVTHPSVKIAPKYNSETTLGYETQRGNPDFRLDLKN